MFNGKKAPRNRLTYYILRPFAVIYVHLFYNIKCFGKENIPKSGGFILACNHISFADPVMLVAECTRACHFMAKSELFKKPGLGFVLKIMNAFPVKRGKSDWKALEYAENIIKKGFVLGIFPEGKKQKNRCPIAPKSGIAYIAKNTKADILPVSIYHTPGERKIRPKITIRFGKIIENSQLGFTQNDSRQQIKEAAQYIMSKIVESWNKKHE